MHICSFKYANKPSKTASKSLNFVLLLDRSILILRRTPWLIRSVCLIKITYVKNEDSSDPISQKTFTLLAKFRLMPDGRKDDSHMTALPAYCSTCSIWHPSWSRCISFRSLTQNDMSYLWTYLDSQCDGSRNLQKKFHLFQLNCKLRGADNKAVLYVTAEA